MTAPLRHSCRRCRLKLAEPVENQRSAFCCRGCHRQHYEKRCLVCERPVTTRRQVCRLPKCQTEFRSLKRHSALGKFDPGHSPIGVNLASGTPISKGSAGWHQVAGPSISDMHLATLSPPRQRVAETLIKRTGPPVNLVGGYKFPGAPTVAL